ncbi:MAG: hypothetical protein AABX51_08275 [Nanoarchaeota archaeon]
MAIDTIFIMVVSVISIFFLLFLFTGKLPGVGKEVYCKTFFHLASSKLFPEQIRQSQDYCVNSDKEKAIIYQANPRKFVRSTLADGATTARISPSIVGSEILTLSIPDDARVISTNFTFFTKETLPSLEINVGNDLTTEFTLLNPDLNKRFSISDLSITDEIYRQLNLSAKPCPLGECQIPIKITAGGNVTLTGFEIQYSSCGIISTTIAQMQLCNERSGLGTSAVNIICGEIAVSSSCQAAVADNAEIAKRIIKENLCQQLPMESFGCGAGEKVMWLRTSINPAENILIEYRADTKQIAVS